MRNTTLLLLLFLFTSCQKEGTQLFTELSESQTGINFRNLIKEDENFNIFQYQYYYNGGGVAVGDFNNDQLQDLVFTGNMVKNRMYLNQGDLEFKDITGQSRIAEKEGWCTGAVPVDINEDGWLDLYICRAGYPFEKLRKNLLFINNGASSNGEITFTEKAEEYGLDDSAHATQAAFFDYDKDGDLDMFLLNHSRLEYSHGSLEVDKLQFKKEPQNTNKLFRNDGGKFINVTEEAGITSNVLTFSLGISIADLDNDGWQDIFIGNDFNEGDYLFFNNGDGTFTEKAKSSLDHTSMFSMGTDAADINNDGLLDLVSLDMLPESNFLQKMHSGADNYNKVQWLIKSGFSPQYSRNMLQLNNGDGTYSEIGQLAGISNTDWSWTALFFDFENDGNKDLFISNGYLRDHTDMDFLNFTANEVQKIDKGENHVDFEEYLAAMPPILQPSYFFRNNGNLQFENVTEDWANDNPKVTQGAAYADLDNDGDLDMIWNNSGEPASVFKNNADRLFENNFLKVELKGKKGNPQGIGAKVKVHAGGEVFYREQNPIRGFQTSVDPILNFGIGQNTSIDSVVVIWNTDEKQTLKNVLANERLTVNFQKSNDRFLPPGKSDPQFSELSEMLNFTHRENPSNDLNQQFLLPYFYSRQGPGIAVGDVNGDGLQDVFCGNAKGISAKLFLQNSNTAFAEISNTAFEEDAKSEDVATKFFDADGDGDLDLFVASGGFNFEWENEALQDRLYLNDGRGNFSKKENALPIHLFPSSCVQAADVDSDGDLDLFVGGAVIPRNFPQSADNQLLINDGNGNFSLSENAVLKVPGIVNDAVWLDLDGDKFPELITAGEWIPIQIFKNDKGVLSPSGQKIETSSGLWNTIHSADFDADGDQDLVVGNFGTNSQFHASQSEPLELYFNDFDGNGSVDPIICHYVGGKSYPIASRDDLINQLPVLKKNFLFFKDYAEAQIDDIFTKELINRSKKLEVNTLETVYLENDNGNFKKRKLPIQTQIAPVHAVTSVDVNGDGHLDILTAGNTSQARIKLGKLDGNHGLILLGDGKGNFRPMPYNKSGISVRDDVRELVSFKNKEGQEMIGFGVNDGRFRLFKKRR